jgi:SAM-dependent methyltransferase
MTANLSSRSYWDNLANGYDALGPPLAPSPEDIRFMEEAVERWACSHRGKKLHALLLGVTPKIVGMRWPEGSQITGLDHSIEMAEHVWPGNDPEKRWVVCGDWLALPLRQSCCDVVIGDGINCLRYPHGFHKLAASVRHGLSDDGIFLLRTFVQPKVQEDPEAVFADRLQCSSFHHFKLRLMMAMQHSVEQGIAVNEVYRFWIDHNVDRDALSLRTGWGRRGIDSIELHNGPNTVHTFPTLQQVRSVFTEFFAEIGTSIPSYPGGDRCPTFLLKPLRSTPCEA